jgi:pimeloyl-ACP methyl ester carboxylesterase
VVSALFKSLLLTALLGLPLSLHAQEFSQSLNAFKALYTDELGQLQACSELNPHKVSVCSPALRNAGNGPYILHHGQVTENVAVLIHGLSDSPFYMRGIAEHLYAKGFNVVVPLLPGHGLNDADAAMEDEALAEHWLAHSKDVIEFASHLGSKLYVGGFSTGGALAVSQYLAKPDQIDALMLFSGALAIDDSAESLSKIWGVKWIAKILDGEYMAHGPNPYKYPSVSSFAGMELMDIIYSIRAQIEGGATIDIPVFAAHSQADTTTPIHGVEDLLTVVTADTSYFQIAEKYQLCHADLVVNSKMVADMHFDSSHVDPRNTCAIPTANPVFNKMLGALDGFILMNDTFIH